MFSVYGRGDKRNWILTKAIKYLKENLKASSGKCSKPFSLTRVHDIAVGFDLIIKDNTCGVSNLSSLDFPLLIDYLKFLELLAQKNLFTFIENDTPEWELSRKVESIDTIRWQPTLDKKEGFLEVLK